MKRSKHVVALGRSLEPRKRVYSLVAGCYAIEKGRGFQRAMRYSQESASGSQDVTGCEQMRGDPRRRVTFADAQKQLGEEPVDCERLVRH